MAETPNINIQIDKEALKAQIESTIQEAMRDAAMSLRQAADDLDGGAWWRIHEEYIEERIAAAVAASRPTPEQTGENR